MIDTTMSDDLIQAVQADQRDAGEPVRPGATAAQIEQLRRDSKARLGIEPPAAYLDFLRRSNGLDYNGLVVYDCASSPDARTNGFWQGLVAANQLWRENVALKSVLVLGDSDLDLFAWDPAQDSWLRMDRVAHDRVRPYVSFEAMIEEVLRARL